MQDDAMMEAVDVEPIAKKMRQVSTASTSSQSTMSQFVVKTTQKEKHKIDLQVARYFYATNTPFRHCEHPEFIKLMELFRPGYSPPNKKNMGRKMLDEKITLKSDMEKNLRGKVVCMALDGWSNIRNEPIVCVSVTTTEGGDNAANMVKMRRELMQLEDGDIGDIITYGCSAHLLNLFAKDIEVEIKSKVKKIIKSRDWSSRAHAGPVLTVGRFYLPLQCLDNVYDRCLYVFYELRNEWLNITNLKTPWSLLELSTFRFVGLSIVRLPLSGY
ncbi:hypothetical protein EVAR_80975_1 [Eumeta japonica]|uniref:DUF659 domain-containing protein n=1 Tax=Eumeta variegata TaxID=151549 RepID=A0A4C1WPT9_EUMVA|nr:hypothetical protein EVAR_80975_1 [Eumeta japonica]